MEESRKELEQQMAKEVERRVEQGVSTGVAIIIAVAITFVISLVLFKVVWAWVVPDLFPGAVAQGLVVDDLSWLAAVKLAVLVAVLGGFSPALTEAFKTRV
jgi:uncharacterized membrane protein